MALITSRVAPLIIVMGHPKVDSERTLQPGGAKVGTHFLLASFIA